MTCTDCPKLKQLFCIVACDEMSARLYEEEEDGIMISPKTIALVIIATALFICALAAATYPLPSNLEELALSPSALGRLQGVQP